MGLFRPSSAAVISSMGKAYSDTIKASLPPRTEEDIRRDYLTDRISVTEYELQLEDYYRNQVDPL